MNVIKCRAADILWHS